MGVRGPQRREGALRRTGWRPPLVQGCYQDLVLLMANRPEFRGSTRAVIEAALLSFATESELQQIPANHERS